ncbi:MAG: hypothetical protein ABSF98_14220 [Bryobacteraceae bacterium]|jgi:hypothetical protein
MRCTAILAALLAVTLSAQRGGVGALRTNNPAILHSWDFPGADAGAQINAAYAALPATGGAIIVDESGAFSTPILLNTQDKPAVISGLPGDAVTLTYTAAASVAMTFDYGMGHRMGHGLRDLTLTGPGNATATTGVVFGGGNGAEGIDFRDFKIQSFGVNVAMGSHTWLANFEHGMIRDGGINVLLPSGLADAGEQIRFDHVTFADAPAPHTNSVWVQGGGQEVVFTDCSFDQAQLRIGNGAVSAAQVTVKGTHFENPNWNWAGAVAYDYIVLDANPGNLLRLTDSYLLQDAPSGGPRRFVMANGGRLVLCGVGMYTPAGSPLQYFAMLAGGAVQQNWGFENLAADFTSGGMWGKQ